MPTTSYMNLVLPTPSSTAGPLWATELNTAFGVIDTHNHTSGQGVAVPTAGLNINADLTFANNNATTLRSVRYTNQGSALSTANDLCCVYASGGNLYYNNASGQQIQITAGNSLNAASLGGIGGDYATSGASVYYTNASSSYSFTSSGNIFANMYTGATSIYPTGTNSHAVTLTAPSLLGSSYALTFPLALPASTKILTVDNTGQIGDAYDVDNSTIGVTSNTIGVKSQGITATQIANGTITATQIASSTITLNKMATRALTDGGTINFTTTSTSRVDVTGASVTFTSYGNPIVVNLQGGYVKIGNDTSQGQATVWTMCDGVDQCATYYKNFLAAGNTLAYPAGFLCVFAMTAGTHTIKLQTALDASGLEIQFKDTKIIVYEV